MYIEFKLPTGATGVAAALANRMITQELHKWSDQYNIPYNTKTIKYTKRVTFDDDALYSFFAMTWNPDEGNHMFNYRLVEPMNTRDK